MRLVADLGIADAPRADHAQYGAFRPSILNLGPARPLSKSSETAAFLSELNALAPVGKSRPFTNQANQF